MTTEPTTPTAEAVLERRRRLTDLHTSGSFVLVNVADAGSARAAADGGARALGTTSSALAAMLGRADAEGAVTRDEVLGFVRAITRSVDVPLSVDAEDGWGTEPGAVAETIHALAEAGAAGASIEDWSGADGGLFDTDLAVARIAAAVDAAAAHPGFVLCARSEGYLYPGDHDPLTMALDRLPRFADVGAHCVYAPGPTDLPTVEALVGCSEAPLNVLVPVTADGSPKVAHAPLVEAGVRRISVGGSLHAAQQHWLRTTVAALLAG